MVDIFLLSFLSMAPSATAATSSEPVEVGVIVEPIVAADIGHDRPAEDVGESWIWIHADARQRLGRSTWFLGLTGTHHIRWGEDVEGIWDVRPAESGWAGPVGPLHLRTGMLVERWGKLDLLPVVDVLNPADLRSGPLASLEATRIPIAMAVLQGGTDSIRAEAVVVPFAGADQANMVGSDWSVIRPGMLEGFLAQAAQWDGGMGLVLAGPLANLEDGLSSVSPSTTRALSDAMSGAGLPEAIALNGEAAVRLEAEGRGIDGALMAGALRSRVPRVEMDPQLRAILERGSWPDLDELSTLSSALTDPVTTTWPRTAMVGGELAAVTGPIGWRAEGGWWSNTVVQRPWFSTAMSPAVQAGLGVDWSHQTILFLSLEGSWRKLLAPPPDPFLTRAEIFALGAMVRVSALADRLEIRSATIVIPTLREYLTRPEIRWRVSDPIELGVGAVILGGPDPVPQTLTAAMDYTGGPFGYWGDNDCVFASLRWIQ